MKIYVKGGITYWILDEDDDVLTTEQELGLIRETQTEEIVAYLKTEDGVVPIYPTSVSPEITGYWLLNQDNKIILNDDADKDVGIWAKWQYSFAIYSETDNSLIFYTGFAAPKVGSEYKHKVVTEVFTDFEDTVYTNASQVPWNSYRTSIKYVRFEDSYTIVWPTATAYWFNGFTSLVDLDVSNLNTSKTTSYSNFATGCTSLKSVTISSRFTLFSKSSQLVDQMTWYDIDKNIVSNNYLISFSATGAYWNDIWAIPAKQAIAIYSASDNSLTFYYDYMPTVGTVYNGKVVTALYYDFAATNYNSASEVPWSSYATSVKKVIFDSSYYEVQTYTGFGHDEYCIIGHEDLDIVGSKESTHYYILTDENDVPISYCSYLSTAYWFSGFTNCTSFDLTGLYTSTITNMQYMFYGCTSVTTLDLSGFDTGNVVTYNNFLINCDSLEEIIISDTFDLFARSDKALVSQQYWHDADGYNVNNYLIGVKGDLDLTIGEVYAAFAIYSIDDNSLIFYSDSPKNVPVEGSKYNNKTATEVYTGVDTDEYTGSNWGNNDVPWYSHHDEITNIIVDKSFASVKPVSTALWFTYCRGCSYIDITYLDTSEVSNMSYMFYCLGYFAENIISLDVSNLNTSKVTNMQGMFQAMNASELDVSSFDTSNVTNMYYMFGGCDNLSKLDVSNWDTSKVTDMSYMFASEAKLTYLDLSTWDVSNVISMAGMFSGSYGMDSTLKEINISNWKLSNNLTDLENLFSQCVSLETIVGLEDLDVSNITDMAWMFEDCTSFKTIDVSNFNTSKVVDMSYMFDKCTNLTTIYSNDSNFVISAVTSDTRMFRQCSSLVGGNGTTFSSSHIDSSYAHVDKSSNPGYFTDIADSDIVAPFAIYSEDDNSLIFYASHENVPRTGSQYNEKTVTNVYTNFLDTEYTEDNLPQWHEVCELIKSASFDESFAEVQPLYTTYWFYEMVNCTSINTDNLDTSLVTNMHDMFSGLESLEELNVNNLDVGNVTSMYGIFYDCSKLTTIDISNWQTDSLTDAHGIFDSCSGLVTLDVSNLNTSKVTDMQRMFYYCESLQTIYSDDDVFVTTEVTSSNNMFTADTSLVGGNGTKFDSSHIDASYAHVDVESNPGYFTDKTIKAFAVYSEDDNSLTFYSDEKLPASGEKYNNKTVTNTYTGFDSVSYSLAADIPWASKRENIKIVSTDSTFKDIYPVSTAYWFYGFTNCTEIDLTYLDTRKVTAMTSMFAECNSLEAMYVNESRFDTSNVIDMNYMNEGLYKITSINMEFFNTENVTKLYSFCYGDSKLVDINLSGWDTSNVIDMASMFEKCSALTTIYATDGKFVTSKVTSGDDVFYNCYSIVGGNGTTYSDSHDDYTYARVDKSSAPGYFTSATEIISLSTNSKSDDRIQIMKSDM